MEADWPEGAAGMAIDEQNPRADEVCTCTAQVNRVGNLPSWRQRLRTHVVSRGIQMMCGSTVDVSADAAADIPLVRAAVRLSWLKALNAVGVTTFIATRAFPVGIESEGFPTAVA